jgi:hypothetical protein
LAKKGTFLLRTDPAVLDALRRWADDEFRSMNGQLELLLHRALEEAGRLTQKDQRRPSTAEPRSQGAPTRADERQQ